MEVVFSFLIVFSGIVVQKLEKNNTVNILCHERLAIVDPSGGAQPLLNGKLIMFPNENRRERKHRIDC